MTTVSVDLLLPLFSDVVDMVTLTWSSFRTRDLGPLDGAAALRRRVHAREKELTEGLLAGPERFRFVPGHLERVGDALEGLVRCQRTLGAEKTVFTEGGIREIDELFGRSLELLECTRDLAITGNQVLARHVEISSMRFQDVATRFAGAHEQRLIEGVCQPEASSVYLAMLDHLRDIARHTRQAAGRLAAGRTAPAGRAATPAAGPERRSLEAI
jgi:hypothetical protein